MTISKNNTKQGKSYEPHRLYHEITIRTRDRESVFHSIYHVKTFFKWYNLPGMMFFGSRDKFDAGSEIWCLFPFPPFYWFKVRYHTVHANQSIHGDFKGLMVGNIDWYVKDVSDTE